MRENAREGNKVFLETRGLDAFFNIMAPSAMHTLHHAAHQMVAEKDGILQSARQGRESVENSNRFHLWTFIFSVLDEAVKTSSHSHSYECALRLVRPSFTLNLMKFASTRKEFSLNFSTKSSPTGNSFPRTEVLGTVRTSGSSYCYNSQRSVYKAC